MGKIVRLPTKASSRVGFQRVKPTYTIREISRQFGLTEPRIRKWTQEGLIQTALSPSSGELLYDFNALRKFRHVRELRNQGVSLRRIESELRGQLNLFPEPESAIIDFPIRRSPVEEALLLHDRGDARAAEYYQIAIKEGDYVADAYCNLGILEFESGRVSKAMDCFTNALKHDPRHLESYYNLANLYFEAGDLRLARIHYEMAAELEPSFSYVYFNLGLVHALTGELSAAAIALTKYKDLAPEDEHGQADGLLARLEKALAHQHRSNA